MKHLTAKQPDVFVKSWLRSETELDVTFIRWPETGLRVTVLLPVSYLSIEDKSMDITPMSYGLISQLFIGDSCWKKTKKTMEWIVVLYSATCLCTALALTSTKELVEVACLHRLMSN